MVWLGGFFPILPRLAVEYKHLSPGGVASKLAEVSEMRRSAAESSMNRIFRLFCMISVAAAVAAGQTTQSSTDSKQPEANAPQSSPRKVDKSAAYYHYALAHM